MAVRHNQQNAYVQFHILNGKKKRFAESSVVWKETNNTLLMGPMELEWNKTEEKNFTSMNWTTQKMYLNSSDQTEENWQRNRWRPTTTTTKKSTQTQNYTRERNMFVERPLPTLLYAIRYTIFVVYFSFASIAFKHISFIFFFSVYLFYS